ncbi:MAG: S8 family serine peptidase [Candidatus Contendobacter sp.]
MTQASSTQRDRGLAAWWYGLLAVLLIFMIPVAQAGSARNWLSDQNRATLEQGQEIDALVELDQTEAVTLAEARRRQAALIHDDDAILAERVASYQRQKENLFTWLPADQVLLKRDYSHLPMLFVRLHSPAALQALLKQPGVKAVYSNVKLRHMLAQSLPLIQQPETAAQGGTGTGTTVAVLDTGVDYTRAAFGSCSVPGGACKVAYAADFAPDDGARDDAGHGTNVAGIVLGVAPASRIIALDVFRTDGCGPDMDRCANAADIIAAINWAIANKAARTYALTGG